MDDELKRTGEAVANTGSNELPGASVGLEQR